MTTTEPGLRERKRLATRARIEKAAVELVLADGLDGATIEAISERAEISARTFFNYFDSKDAAVLGVTPDEASEAEHGDVVAGLRDLAEVDPLRAVVRLAVTETGVLDQSDNTLHRRRKELIRRHPDLVQSQFVRLMHRKERMVASVTELLRAGSAFPAAELSTYADLVLVLALTTVRTTVENAPDDSDLDPADIEARALDLITTLTRSLA
ncbi:TetR family transcriptional regulator [Marmoricola endophyticus]|uniref:TetR family transcriptional regulator n=1 Tax=Marmoricola endophyticus TaxID=2040280 RepID=A0A917BFR7_9ACTN|nr:TetR/AcrR family transcriptional regulator [Marmoricola endophyticus]GGF42059.1 TetR family transcriptional regulator [Marmoricola endophyticus]